MSKSKLKLLNIIRNIKENRSIALSNESFVFQLCQICFKNKYFDFNDRPSNIYRIIILKSIQSIDENKKKFKNNCEIKENEIKIINKMMTNILKQSIKDKWI